MKRKLLRFSIRTYVGLIVVLMGLLGLGLALGTGEFYRYLIFDNQRASLAKFGEREIERLLEAAEQASHDFALNLQHEDELRAAYGARDRRALEELLNRQFHQYYVTAGILDLEGIVVFDGELRVVAYSTEGEARPLAHPEGLCGGFVATARERRGPDRIKPVAAICADGAYHVVLAPIGGLRVIGYVAVLTNPLHYLARLESILGIPVRIRTLAGQTLAASEAWPHARSLRETLMATVDVRAANGTPVYRVELVGDTASLDGQLSQARYLVMTAAGLTTAGMIMLALFVFSMTTIRPLKELTEHLRLLRNDRSRLGEEIRTVANAEVAELADDFNEMTAELKELHDTLHSLAHTDALTGLPNRILFHDRLEQQVRFAARDVDGFAVCMIDLDRFKEINDTLGHHAGDLLLQQVSHRMKSALRKSDTLSYAVCTVARLGGDEFSVILPTVKTLADAEQVAHRLLETVQDAFDIEGHAFKIGMSIGIALYPDHAADAEQLCRLADRAMYAAKRDRSGYAIADAEVDGRAEALAAP